MQNERKDIGMGQACFKEGSNSGSKIIIIRNVCMEIEVPY